MVAAAVIGGVAAVGSGVVASSGAKKAANAQVKAAEQAQEWQERALEKQIASQERMFQTQIGLQEPYRQAGLTAQQQLMYLLGVGSPEDYKNIQISAPQFATQAAPPPTPAQTQAAGPYAGLINYLNRQAGVQTTQPVAPSTVPASSVGMQGRTFTPSGEFGSLAKPFGIEQFEADPGYAFRQAEGMKALERSAAARGGLLSGSMLKGIQRYGQNLASDEYTNAFNRYQIERNARLNPLQSLMGSSQSATNVMTSAAGNLGQSLSNAYGAAGAGQANAALAAGQARASGYIGSANAMAGALGSIGQAATQYPLYSAQIDLLKRTPQL